MSGVELIRLIVSAATPIVVFILGFFLLRCIEAIKDSVAMRSDFPRRWADNFFECCQDFMAALERETALLAYVSRLDDPNGEIGTPLQKENSTLHLLIGELELRIRRNVVFAPQNGSEVRATASSCFELLSKLMSAKQGNLDEIFEKVNLFNEKAKMAHAEMIGAGRL